MANFIDSVLLVFRYMGNSFIETLANDVVSDDELLYRSVSRDLRGYSVTESTVRISSQAFSDRSRCPSVDRAKIRDHKPEFTLKSPNDGVVGLIAKDVRGIAETQNDSKGQPICVYKIDVFPRPTEENPSHAQIEPSPEYKNSTPFKKVLEKLACQATIRIQNYGWEIESPELRTQ